jgi:hypothetical protein
MNKSIIEQMIDKETVKYETYGERTVVCFATTLEGFEIVGKAFCLHKDEFSLEVGKSIAFEDVINQLEEYEGYRLSYDIYTKRQIKNHMEQMREKTDPVIETAVLFKKREDEQIEKMLEEREDAKVTHNLDDLRKKLNKENK